VYPTQQGGKQANENVKGYFPPTQNSNQLQINDVGLYSISKPKEAEQISQIIKSYFKSTKNLTITDANGNMGGNTINFAKHFGTVQTVEISKEHFKLLQNNISNNSSSRLSTTDFPIETRHSILRPPLGR
jgi:hypothetical protein